MRHVVSGRNMTSGMATAIENLVSEPLVSRALNANATSARQSHTSGSEPGICVERVTLPRLLYRLPTACVFLEATDQSLLPFWPVAVWDTRTSALVLQALFDLCIGSLRNSHLAAGCHAVTKLPDDCVQHHWEVSAACRRSAQGVRVLHNLRQSANSFSTNRAMKRM